MPRKFYSIIYPQTRTKDTALIRSFLADKERFKMMIPYFLSEQHEEQACTICLTYKSNKKSDTKKNLIGSTYIPDAASYLHEKGRNDMMFWNDCLLFRSTRSISGICTEAAAHMVVIASTLGLA
jgi:hypothetical protein